MDYFDILFAKTNGVSEGTCYNEIEAMLKSTVGHSSKNLLDITKHTTNTGVSNIQINETTGSLSYTGTGTHVSVGFYAADLGVEMYGKTYTVSCINNLASTADARLAIRKANTNQIVKRVGFGSTGKKSITFTPDVETFPNGWYISVMATGSTSTTGKIDISNLMLREASISNNAFEPYVTPTDEKKQDKPVVLWEAALNSTGVSDVPISSLADDVSNYSYLKVVVTDESETTITDQDAVMTTAEYDTAYIGRAVTVSGAMLGMHPENGVLVFDRLFIWVFSEGTNISVRGLRNHNDTSTAPDVVPSVFIRKIIGIPK